VQAVGKINHQLADKIVLNLLHQLEDGILPPFLWLEVLEVAATKTDPLISALLKKLRSQNQEDPVRNYLECLEGGSAYRGEDVFLEEAACFTCHSFRGKGGRIGPDLTGVGGTLERIYILQSIVDPNASIAPGFQNVLLELQNGSSLTGVLHSEDSDSLKICVPPEGTIHIVPADDVRSRTPLPSAMPLGLAQVLGRRKLRDLVEFLAAPQ
jgi:quinoprotein glucose dehydrogenase